MKEIKISELQGTEQVSEAELQAVTGGAAYMKLGDIKGESSDKDHKGWIDILSVSSPIYR